MRAGVCRFGARGAFKATAARPTHVDMERARTPTRLLLLAALALCAALAGLAGLAAPQAHARPNFLDLTSNINRLGFIEPTRQPDTWIGAVRSSRGGGSYFDVTITCDRGTLTCGTRDGRVARCEAGKSGCILAFPEEEVRPDVAYVTLTVSARTAINVYSRDSRRLAFSRPPQDFFPPPATGFPGPAVVLLLATYVACEAVLDRGEARCPDPRVNPPATLPRSEPFVGDAQEGPRVERRALFAWRPAGRFSPHRVRAGAQPVRCATARRCVLAGPTPAAGRPAAVTRAGDVWIVRDADGWRLGPVLGLGGGARVGETALRAALARL